MAHPTILARSHSGGGATVVRGRRASNAAVPQWSNMALSDGRWGSPRAAGRGRNTAFRAGAMAARGDECNAICMSLSKHINSRGRRRSRPHARHADRQATQARTTRSISLGRASARCGGDMRAMQGQKHQAQRSKSRAPQNPTPARPTHVPTTRLHFASPHAHATVRHKDSVGRS